MMLCDDAQPDPVNPHKITIVGLLSSLRATAPVAEFPVVASFCVYLQLTECRGSGTGQIVVANADTQEVVYTGSDHQMQFGTDPLRVYAIVFRIPLCIFPERGVYWIEFRYNEVTLAHEPLSVR
jgi:hypothetical protein